MRFHQLNFCNLKSLKGTYKLDLDLEFGSEELFLIFGEMGTGKTTIFDAISLALFGFTPKLRSSFSSSNNDSIRHILNEESKSCSVDLIFSFLNKEFFKASWSFRLTNSGNAVAPTRSLTRLNDKFERTELLYSGQQVGPANAIFSQTLHGLEFEDFIRSILLPQGGFAKFIEARPKDRIEILERITNTRIYADISQQAAQIRGQKKKVHTNLEDQIKGLPSLDEVRSMRIHQKENIKKISYLKRKREVKSFSRTWFDRSEKITRARVQQERLEEQRKRILVDIESLSKTCKEQEKQLLHSEKTHKSHQNLVEKNQETLTKLKKVQQKTQHLVHQLHTIQKKLGRLHQQKTALPKSDIPTQDECIEAENNKKGLLLQLQNYLKQSHDLDGTPNKHLQASPMERYQLRLEYIQQQLELIQRVQGTNAQIESLLQRRRKYEKVLEDLQKEEASCNQEIETSTKKRTLLKEELSACLLDIQMYKLRLQPHELRANLTEGSPCTVCGSTTHPYAHNPQEEQKIRERLLTHEKKETTLKKDIETCAKHLEEKNRQKNHAVGRQENGRIEIEKLCASIAAEQKSLQEGLQLLQIENINVLAHKRGTLERYKHALNGIFREYEHAAAHNQKLLEQQLKGREEQQKYMRIQQELEQYTDELKKLSQEKDTLVQESASYLDILRSSFSLQDHGIDIAQYCTQEDLRLISLLRSTKMELGMAQQRLLQRKEDLQRIDEDTETYKKEYQQESVFLEGLQTKLETLFADILIEPAPLSSSEPIPLFPPDSSIGEKFTILEDWYHEEDLIRLEFEQKNIKERLVLYQENKSKIEEVKIAFEEFHAWEQLNKALNTGTSFRYFAQTVILQNLIDRANIQLREIMSSYHLSIRKDEEGAPLLDFNVSKTSGGERPICTLSGGETFLLALSFALALANLRKIHMPIQTLLIDEGFGHLDAQSVSVVIAGLESLKKRNIQVGLISHVTALQERIAARVCVADLKTNA